MATGCGVCSLPEGIEKYVRKLREGISMPDTRLGATEVTPDTICLMAGVEALQYVYGTALDGFDRGTARDAACIVVWGANPAASGPHAHEYWLREAPGQVIVIDSVRTTTAHDLPLQPFPGSDAALAFALLHVLWRDNLIDSDFVAAHTL